MVRGVGAVVSVCGLFFAPAVVLARSRADESFASRPLVLLLALAAMALLPFVFSLATSFAKMTVVFSLLRSALGTQGVPPTTVIAGLAAILSVYVMYPTGVRMVRAAAPVVEDTARSELDVDRVVRVAAEMKEPLRDFLRRHAHDADVRLFVDLAKRSRPADQRDAVQSSDLLVVLPAFVVSELTEAFEIGFLVFLPFLVVELVVANLLLALGMHMLSPTAVSMPFKLLLFVLVDGWALLARGLVLGYA